MNKQNTLKGSFSLCGKGLHTGINLTVTFNPAPENHWYKIQRIDLEDMPIINAVAENVVDTQRGTVVAKGDVRVSTIEHAYSNSCPSSWWCHPAISSSVVPFSSCPQSLPASESFPMSQLHMRWPKYWSFSFRIIPSKEHPGHVLHSLQNSPGPLL